MGKPFWSRGVRFQCQGTGRCCMSRGEYGYVYLTLHDRRLLARHLKIPTAQFTKKFCDKTDGYFHLKHPEKNCQFLEGKACSIYDARPTQCRTWPFWPENMPARAWKKEVTRFCPGIGKGPLYSASEIQELLKRDPLFTN